MDRWGEKMQLETARLAVIALTAQQLDLWMTDLAQLEQDLYCTY